VKVPHGEGLANHPRPRVMHEVLLARAAVKRSQGIVSRKRQSAVLYERWRSNHPMLGVDWSERRSRPCNAI
jgi:hypothetical protein